MPHIPSHLPRLPLPAPGFPPRPRASRLHRDTADARITTCLISGAEQNITRDILLKGRSVFFHYYCAPTSGHLTFASAYKPWLSVRIPKQCQFIHFADLQIATGAAIAGVGAAAAYLDAKYHLSDDIATIREQRRARKIAQTWGRAYTSSRD